MQDCRGHFAWKDQIHVISICASHSITGLLKKWFPPLFLRFYWHHTHDQFLCYLFCYREAEVDRFGKFVRSMDDNTLKMKERCQEHCEKSSGSKFKALSSDIFICPQRLHMPCDHLPNCMHIILSISHFLPEANCPVDHEKSSPSVSAFQDHSKTIFLLLNPDTRESCYHASRPILHACI